MKNFMDRLHEMDSAYLRTRADLLRDYAGQAAQTARTYAGTAAGQANSLIDYLMGRAQAFSVLDYAIFKICLICFGAWMATLFSKAAARLKHVFLIGFILSWVYLIWRIFFCEDAE